MLIIVLIRNLFISSVTFLKLLSSRNPKYLLARQWLALVTAAAQQQEYRLRPELLNIYPKLLIVRSVSVSFSLEQWCK